MSFLRLWLFFCCSEYSELLEITDDVEMKSHVYAAMGMLAVKCGDTETAKTAFFQWYVVCAPTENLFCSAIWTDNHTVMHFIHI